MKKPMKQATVYAVGIKVRCRKVDRHTFNLPEVEASQFDQNEAEKQGISLVLRNMKTLQSAKLVVHEFMLEEEGELQIRSFSIGLGRGIASVDLTPRCAQAVAS